MQPENRMRRLRRQIARIPGARVLYHVICMRGLRRQIARILGCHVEFLQANERKFRYWFFRGNDKLVGDYGFISSELIGQMITRNVEFVRFDEDAGRVYLKKDSVIVAVDRYVWIFKEVFLDELYYIQPQLLPDQFVVFDFGMNRGYTALYFLSQTPCEHVYGFEPVKSTFEFALDNIAQNPRMKNRLTLFNVGVGSEDMETEGYVSRDRDGISSYSEEFLDQYAPGFTASAEKSIFRIKQASKVMRELIENDDIRLPIVLKIDIEGHEYEVFDDLAANPDIMRRIDVIVGEYHLGLGRVQAALEGVGFELYTTTATSAQVGDFLFVRKRPLPQKHEADNGT